MEGYCILLFASLGSCVCEWVLLPSISPKQNEMFKNRISHQIEHEVKNSTEFCPDFHNLTVMSYGTVFKGESEPRNEWKISFEDVEEILKENEKVPGTFKEKTNFLKQMGENLMTEAERQVKTLFSPSRQARTFFNFPSMESKLMTISLLLFGVYLSKLIMKLLQANLNRYNGGLTMMTGVRPPIHFTQGLSKRSTAELEDINLMHLIDKYNSRFN